MKLIKYILFLSLIFITVTGCTPPVTYVLDLAYAPPLKQSADTKQGQKRIAVIPFEDVRAEKVLVGTRKRLMGKIDKFEARPSPVYNAVTQAIVRALKINGYQTEILKQGTDPESIKESPPDIIISGKIEELWADALAKPGFTAVKVDIRLKVTIYKVDEKNSFTLNIQSESEPSVVLFTPPEMQNVINDTLTDAINHLIESNWDGKGKEK